MTKLEEAARVVIADYDAREDAMKDCENYVSAPWPEMDALRAALAEQEAAAAGLPSNAQGVLAQRQYQEMQQILAEQYSRPRGVTATDRRVALASILCHAPGDRCLSCDHYRGDAPVCVFANAAKREGLTDDQIIAIRDSMLPGQGEAFDCIAFARAIERALGEQK